MRRLKQAGELLGIPLLDFLVVTHESYWAASEHR
jgi:DNA repair protein RadC